MTEFREVDAAELLQVEGAVSGKTWADEIRDLIMKTLFPKGLGDVAPISTAQPRPHGIL